MSKPASASGEGSGREKTKADAASRREHVVHDDGKEEPPPDPTGGLGFQGMMQEAVKIKEEQMKKERRIWDRFPAYFQHTLFHGESDEKVKAGRKLAPAEQLGVAEEFKQEGNDAYKANNFKLAMEKYERALALLWYYEAVDPEWKKKGLRDESFQIVQLWTKINPQDTELLGKVKDLISKVLNNIAFIGLKSKDWKSCFQACSQALALNPNNAKALYIRAQALVGAPSSGGTEYEQALKDLAQASTLLPSKKGIAAMFKKLQQSMKQQKQKDKEQFGGMFNRGSVRAGEAKQAKAKEEVEKKRKAQQAMTEFERLEQFRKGWLHQAEQQKKMGNEKGFAECMKKVDEITKHIAHMRANMRRQMGIAGLAADNAPFDKPTPEMIEEAKRYGIDLKDPDVLAYLKKLEEERQKDPVDRNHEEEKPAAVNWFVVGAVVVILIAIKLFKSGAANDIIGYFLGRSPAADISMGGADEDFGGEEFD